MQRYAGVVSDSARVLWSADRDGAQGETFRVGTPRRSATLPEDIINVDATQDRQRFLALAPERTTGSVTIVQHWRAASKASTRCGG